MAHATGCCSGTDLVKDRTRLVAAYDDAAGVTAEFNRNVLLVLNRELGARLRPATFEHVARWNEDDQRIEMWLRSLDDQSCPLDDLDLDVTFAAGEELLTEISTKFTPEALRTSSASAGSWWSRPGPRSATSSSCPSPAPLR